MNKTPWLFLGASLFMACDTPDEVWPLEGDSLEALPMAADQVGPPIAADLEISTLVRGTTATLTAYGMPPGGRVTFVASAAGPGVSCPGVLGGDCLGLAGRLRILGAADADLRGIARFQFTVPMVPISQIGFQAVSLASPSNYISDTEIGQLHNLPPLGPSCNIADLDLDWPMPGTDASDWVINNYVDLDPSGVVLDYMGGEKSYDGHNGIDIDVPTFRAMDTDWPITAAAAGEVTALRESEFDRNMSCTGTWNYVEVTYDNGFVAWYGHLKQDSVVVSVGDRVNPGDTVGVVGSSGCSTAPHLHYELHDCAGSVVEPFAWNLWNSPPVYDTPLGLLDAVVQSGWMSSANEIKDPVDNLTGATAGENYAVGVSMAGGEAGDEFIMEVVRPSGAIHETNTKTLTQTYRHHFWYYNRSFGSEIGTWTIRVRVGGSVVWSHDVAVVDGGVSTGEQTVAWGLTSAEYQDLFDTELAGGRKPVWIDVYTDGANARYNAIFEDGGGYAWFAWHNIDGVAHQAKIDQALADGLKITHVDGAMTASGMRYTGIAEDVGGVWYTWFGQDPVAHQGNFDDQRALGHRPVGVAVAGTGSGLSITSLYDNESVGSWEQWYGLDSAAYQAEFNTQLALGRWPAHIDGYDNGGDARFSVVWDSRSRSAGVARHNMNTAVLADELAAWSAIPLTAITGYQHAGAIRYAAVWTDR